VFSQAPFPATAYLARVFYATRSNGNLEVHVTGRGKLRQVIDSVKCESSACNGMLLSGELDYVTIIPFIAGAGTRGLPVECADRLA
jgi:hypothetical protein